jgi:hypothetical protein
MALFILTENKEILNLIAEDFALEFSDIEALEEGSNDEAVGRQVILQHIDAGIKADGDSSKLVQINKALQHVDDLTWLEKLQLKMEKKIREYNQKLKDDSQGTLAKVWTKVKQFLTKVVAAVTKAINKLAYSVKMGYRAGKDQATGGLKSNMDIMTKSGKIKGSAEHRVARHLAANASHAEKGLSAKLKKARSIRAMTR